MRPAAGLVLSTIVPLLPGASSATAVLVEDFETPDTADYITYFAPQLLVTATNTWSVTTASVDLFEDAARPEAAAFDGAQAVDLTGSPGAGVMEAAFPTAPGTQYQLVFHYARNNLLGADTGDAQVEVIGSGLLLQAFVRHDPAQHPFNTYLQFSDTFTADSTQAILRFTSLDPGNTGITIDGILVSEPPPVGVDDGVAWSAWSRLKGMFRR